MSANGPNPTDTTTIEQKLTQATFDGPGVPALLLYSHGTFRRIYAPFIHTSAFGAATSEYEDKVLGIDGDLVGSSVTRWRNYQFIPSLGPVQRQRSS